MAKLMLNAKFVESVKPPTDRKIAEYFDEKVTGLCLRVYASGTKTWTMRFKRGTDKIRLSLGNGSILPLAEARERALELLLADIRGEDVVEKEKPNLTFSEIAYEYIEKHSKPNKRSWKEDLRKIEKDLNPKFGKAKVSEISRRDIINYLDELVKQGVTIKVNRTHGLIREILNFAVDREYIKASPAAGIKKRIKEVSRDRVLAEDEITKVWSAIKTLKSPLKEFFQMYMMTGQRGTEIKQILRSQIDLERMIVGIPKEVSKNKKHHMVPITVEMRKIIQTALLDFRDSRWLFPSPQMYRRDKSSGDFPLKNIQKAIQRLRKVSGVQFNGHDFRRTMATWLAAKGIPRMTISKLLNHSDKSITAVYDRYSYEQEKREALRLWTEFLSKQ